LLITHTSISTSKDKHYVDQQCWVLCFRETETTSHLFASCPKTRINMEAYV